MANMGIIEQWRSVPEWDDYQVSNLGQVRSRKSGQYKILKPSVIGQGYRQVTFSSPGVRKLFFLSRLVAAAFLPNPEGKPHVNHKDFDKSNNQATNLEWATVQENLYHAIIHEMRNRKLTHLQVSEIRSLIGTMTHQEIAEQYGVTRSWISQILRGEQRRILNTD